MNWLVRFRNSGSREDHKTKARRESDFLKLPLWTNGVIHASDDEQDKTFADPDYFEVTKLLLKEIREA